MMIHNAACCLPSYYMYIQIVIISSYRGNDLTEFLIAFLVIQIRYTDDLLFKNSVFLACLVFFSCSKIRYDLKFFKNDLF
jgi:hypothetical protein